MRKAQKEQAGAFLKILGRAHDEIRKQLEKRAKATVLDLLEQCQQGAIELGNMIEEAEGEGCETVGILERYCEAVYQIYREVEQGVAVSVGKVYKGLHKLLVQTENSIKNDIRVKTEAVFLPYKASMWDSLESVWMAADEDPDCDAYVIPIPYYDKNPDGTFREMHYEGDQYPDYVPVTHYEEYDFAGRRPDLVFIHNPYDGHNTVTSVHPFFYSDNLKKYTDCLIYIPYFVSEEIDPQDKAAVERISHFCVTTGAIYADKIVVQSEAMRKIYIDVLTGFMQENTGKDTRKHWEEKVLGLGSPKMDKVKSFNEEDIKIPEDWKRIIRKPDGNRKKVIFYNTGLAALLQHGSDLLEKMKNVFEIFWENREEVALLWRPHPLFMATITSVKPELEEEYEEIVKNYRKQGWGIYDNTADLDRAVALSDAYYGDGSSIVQLFQVVGKPVMIQDVEIK